MPIGHPAIKHLLSLLALLALFCLSFVAPAGCLFTDEDEGQDTRIMYHITNRHTEQDCSPQSSGFVTIEGSVKITTAPPPNKNSQRHKICRAPFVPFGKLTQDRRGINFWFLRLRVTQLLPGQFLVVVNTDYSEIDSSTVEKDQRIDLTHNSHQYPAILYLKYRYARLHWNSTRTEGQENYVNITVSNYARFNDTVNSTMQKELCDRYSNTWCEKSQTKLCIEPNSCSLQEDCFDLYSEPSRCSDNMWIDGNLTSVGSSLRTTSWILRNLPWLALGAVPLVLVVALAKICSQKRDLDIDDDYEYKMSYSDHNAEGRNGGAVRDLEDDGAESSSSSDDEGDDQGGNDQSPYYSYPSPAAHSRGPASSGSAACDNRTEEGSVDSTDVAVEPKLDEPTSEAPDDEEAPPPPPPRLSQVQTAGIVATRTGSFSGGSSAGGRALHRLTEVSLEEETDESAEAAAQRKEDEEEEEFVNVEYLRRQMLQSTTEEPPRVTSGEYTAAAPTDPDNPSPRNSYTRLLSQPSPTTIEELLKPLPTTMTCDVNVGDTGGGVIYAQLVLPPPTRGLPSTTLTLGPLEALELQPVRTPGVGGIGNGGKISPRSPPQQQQPTGGKKERSSYDLNYIVV